MIAAFGEALESNGKLYGRMAVIVPFLGMALTNHDERLLQEIKEISYLTQKLLCLSPSIKSGRKSRLLRLLKLFVCLKCQSQGALMSWKR